MEEKYVFTKKLRNFDVKKLEPSVPTEKVRGCWLLEIFL